MRADWEELEADLDGTEDGVLPQLIAKLLYSLTWNRQIKCVELDVSDSSRENAFENLRKQYLKRDPDNSPLGTVEEPVEWAALGLSAKVGILWQLCEWQLVDPARFRSLLKSEDEASSWVGVVRGVLTAACRPGRMGQGGEYLLPV